MDINEFQKLVIKKAREKGFDDGEIYYQGGDSFQVLVNGGKHGSMELATEASKRFGKDRILVSLDNVNFIFKNQNALNENFHELYVLNTAILDAIEGITDVPYIVNLSESIKRLLSTDL